MIRIKLTTPFPGEPWEKQTPQSSGVWGNCTFLINKEVSECDFWVVYDNLLGTGTTCCPARNTILITGEPPSIRHYTHEYLKQFATVITCHRKLRHPNVVHQQQGLPWQIGWRRRGNYFISSKDYDELSAIRNFKKDRLVSVIVSSKDFTAGHRRRLKFVEHLSQYFGPKLDVYGRGIREIDDKWEAIARYKYHIVLENSAVPDYWTEKLADAYLGGAFPLYYGCPNLPKYFPPTAFMQFDLKDSSSVDRIERFIEDHSYECAIGAIHHAREMVLNKYNLFAMLCDYCNDIGISGKKDQITIMPMRDNRTFLVRNITHKIWRRFMLLRSC
jgi:hypothetical protein